MKLYRCLYSILSKCQFFCGVIWILTNSFMCRKRVQVDEQIWTFLKAKDKRAASHCTKTKHQVWSYSIYFYNVWRVGSCDVKKKKKKKKKAEKQNRVMLPFFSCSVRPRTKSSDDDDDAQSRVQPQSVSGTERESSPSWYHSCVIKANGMCLHWSLIFFFVTYVTL